MNDKADRIKRMKLPPVDPALAHRLPPGQILTERFPILHEGEVPTYDMDKWTLRIFGEVEAEKQFSYAELMRLPQRKLVTDIHCVTRWSRFDNEFEGIRFRDLLETVQIKPQAKYVMIHADYDYDTNLPLSELLGDNVLLAHKWGGEKLTAKHGWPLRLVVPHLYFWKSAKWIRGIELMSEDRPGFWERNGFHNEADPFKEQRFSGEALPIPEDEWERKEYD
ncbi:sulfite oxidase-like oxidoreductase [Brevibacillus fulvus]|uniref:DMSO/TMAO reductase YedYZ molybdopterin-dependent catalytic subunit n=1 Tax=Brevibacillus fulvus TaxID=1125967 RepID=A0A939BT02_9BACL|nr:sulfite oxidase-like oxidoreductase [Brevibacillus fulvus]MBM7591287.1 DMSO/TMAO reductase YedYZ molybdopterin-dependent catalytic subunit [Brevibacillus fulvus]